MRRDYIDLLGDYIPRGQKHYKLRLPKGCARLSVRSKDTLETSAQAGDVRAADILAGNISPAVRRP